MTNQRTDRQGTAGERGFTLVELIIVMAIIALLASIAIPSYVKSIKKANEAVLKEDLHTMRTAIDSYTVDQEKPPQSLDDLLQAGYLKSIPKDPMTSRADTWITSQGDSVMDLSQSQGGIDDVHSGSQGISTEGTIYTTW